MFKATITITTDTIDSKDLTVELECDPQLAADDFGDNGDFSRLSSPARAAMRMIRSLSSQSASTEIEFAPVEGDTANDQIG